MPLTIRDNTLQLDISRYMNMTNVQLNKSMQRLATGFKVNQASDGSAAIAVISTMTSQINGYGTATDNAQQGLGVLQIADGALQQINDHLQNIRDIAVAAANGTTTTAQFTAYQANLTAEIGAINTIASSTKYGSKVLLNGSISGGSGFSIQIGPNSSDSLDIKSAFTNNAAGSGGLGITQTTLSSTANANSLLSQVDSAINTATSNLAVIGGYENRMSNQMSYLDVAKTNLSASLSSIRDTDIAAESSNLARLQIIQQAQVFALAQANTQPSLAFKLLSG